MIEKVRRFALGFLPLMTGYLLNFLILNTVAPILLLNVLFLLLWTYLCYRFAEPGRNALLQSLCICAVGFVMLALVLFQEIGMGEYWPNAIGFASQIYFLPLITLMTIPIAPFMDVITTRAIMIAVQICLFVASCLACRLKTKRNKG